MDLLFGNLLNNLIKVFSKILKSNLFNTI